MFYFYYLKKLTALADLHNAEEFLEETKVKIGNIAVDGYEAENAKNTADVFVIDFFVYKNVDCVIEFIFPIC